MTAQIPADHATSWSTDLREFLLVSHRTNGSSAADETSWETVWDTGVTGSGKPVLCRAHNPATGSGSRDEYDDLYWLDANTSSTNPGLWRYRSGAWTQLATVAQMSGLSPNCIPGWGAAFYNNTIVVGETTGNVHTVSFDTSGAFSSFTLIKNGSAATPVMEDSLIGPVFNGKLYIGSGTNGTDGGSLWTWDGSTFALIRDFTSEFGGNSYVTDFAIAHGLLWFFVNKNDQTKTWLCALDLNDTITVQWAGTGLAASPGWPIDGSLSNWRGELVASMIKTTGGNVAKVFSFTGGGWTPISLDPGNVGATFPVGNALMLYISGNGPQFLTDDGKFSPANPTGWDSANALTLSDMIEHDGYLWIVTWQNTNQLQRLNIGTDHVALAGSGRRTQAGGRVAVPLINVITGPGTVVPTSGTAFQVSTASEKRLNVPVTFNSNGGTATCKVEIGPSSSGTFYTLFTETLPPGGIDGVIRGVQFTAPQGWYAKLTTANATLGTASYY